MKKISKYRVDYVLVITLVLLIGISLLSIYSAENLLSFSPFSLVIKQGIWYLIGFVLIFLVMTLGTDFFFKYAYIFYGVCVIALVGLLLFAPTISNSKCWFVIPGIGNVQPSEFMKIALILVIARIIYQFNLVQFHNLFDEFILIIKVVGITLVPAILTFLQPDTGVVIIYLIIMISMLISSGIRLRWFVIAGIIVGVLLGAFFLLYFYKSDTFISIFGNKFFYRMDRIVDWKGGEGMQLNNASLAIGSAYLLGHGLLNTPIYFPEAHTDFIFAVFSSNFGLIGSLILIVIFLIFNGRIISIGYNSNSNISKYVIAGIIGMILYQQFQNIGMTIGLLPITGITLPFISYGGSSLLSYMFIVGFVLTIKNERVRNKKNCYM